jgi:hypothetical protein
LLVCIQRSRNAGFSGYNVTPLPKDCCSTLFTTGYKRPTKGGLEAFLGLFALGFYFGLLVLALALALTWVFFTWGFGFGLFGVENFWKGKELLKEKNC